MWAAAAALLQSCLTLCDPIDGNSPGFTVPGILQARTLEWVAISFSNAWKWKVKSLSCVWLLVIPWTAAYQASIHGIFQARVLEWVAIAFSDGCEHWINKDSWALKNCCFWIVVLEKTLQSPLNCKETKPVNPKGNQSWVFMGRTDAEAPILWLPDARSWLIGKDPDSGKDWGQEENGETEDEMVVWDHWLDGHEFEQALGIGDWQGSLACCSPQCGKESDMT